MSISLQKKPLLFTPKSPQYAQSKSSEQIRASTVDFSQRLKGGALTIEICNCYTIRIYTHYWIWQIPVLLTNIALFIIWFMYSNDIILELGFIAVGSVFIAALVRDNIFLWLIYWSLKYCCCCTKFIRYHISRLADCIGGLHSSFGIAAFAWNAVYAVHLFTFEYYEFNVRTLTGFCLPILLFLICISALPCFRHYYHNTFELMHRYLNWIALLILTIHICFMNINAFHDMYHITLNTPSLFTFGLIILTFYPWIIIHKIKGKNIEIYPSQNGKTVAFVFPIWCPVGSVCKLSINWMEFHVFGITPLPDHQNHHRSLVLVKDLGDWTKILCLKAERQELNDTNFWIHRIKSANFTQGLFNWKRVFIIATGVGIAPLLPYVVQPEYYQIQISLTWIERDHEKNYPKIILDLLKPLTNAVLYDTAKQKHSDLSLYTVRKAEEFHAEAVFIVSCPSIAYSVANYAHKKGIPVFASNFDV